MRRLCGAGLAVVLLAVVAITVGGSALAYFTSTGSGSASAAVTKLTAPTISAATAAAGGTVTLTWGAVTPPGAGSVRYYVTRDGGDPAGTCPVDTAPTTVLTCKDSGVAVGEHTYRVTATWKTWTATGTAKTANVTIGETTKFTIAGSTASPAAGGSVNLTITAKDASNSTVTTYTGSHSLIFSGASSSPGNNAPTVANSSGSAIAFGSATALAFTAGVATITSSTKNGVLKIYKAGPASVSATEGSLTTPVPLALTVTPAAAARYVLAAASAGPAAGAEDDLTITAQDGYGNTATDYTGSHSLVFSGASASPGGNVPTVTSSSGAEVAFGAATEIEFSAGVAVAGEGTGGTMKLFKSGSTAVKAAEGTTVTTPTAVTVTVAQGPAAKLALTSSTPTPLAAANFNLTTTAQDAYGNTATAYTGAKNITFSGATASPSGAQPTVVNSAGGVINFGSPTALTFSAGVAAVSASKNGYAKLSKAGATSVMATDGTLTTPTPLALTVGVGTASKLALLDLTASAGSVGSPCLFTCAITALGNSGTVKADIAITDSSGNVASNIGTAKTVNVTVTAGGTITGTPLAIPAAGLAVTTTEFTYTAPASGAFTHTITAASSGYSNATATASK